MPAIARHKAAVAAYDAAEGRLASGDVEPPLLLKTRTDLEKLGKARRAAFNTLIATNTSAPRRLGGPSGPSAPKTGKSFPVATS